MATQSLAPELPRRVWFTVAAVLAAALVAFLGGLDVYLYEDGSPFAHAAYRAAPFLDLSFSLIYVTALAIGVASVDVARAARAGGETDRRIPARAISPRAADYLRRAAGLLGHRASASPATFLSLVLLLAGAVTLMLLVTRLATARLLRLAVAHPIAATLGACAGLVTLLLVDGGLTLAHLLVLRRRWPRSLRHDTGRRFRHQRTGDRLRTRGVPHLSRRLPGSCAAASAQRIGRLATEQVARYLWRQAIGRDLCYTRHRVTSQRDPRKEPAVQRPADPPAIR